MRKVVFEIGISRDGFIEGPNGELDWWIFDEEVLAGITNRYDTVFYGRFAYEKFGVSRSPQSQSDIEYEFDTITSTMRKYVFSRSLKHVAGNGMVINDNVEAHVKRIKQEEGKDIWLCGGADIFNTFTALDLIDEYLLTLHPNILGSGKPLFKNLSDRLNLKLLQTRYSLSGLVLLYYQPLSRINNHVYDRSI